MKTGTEGSNPSLSEPFFPDLWIDIPYLAEKEHAGLRLDTFLSRRMKSRSRSDIQRLIESGKVSLQGRALKVAARIKAGETVLVRFPRREDPPAEFESLPVLFDDEHLVVVDKPGRLLTHPTDKTRRNSATEIVRRQFGLERLHSVHRLDRETSGVLILAKNRAAAKAMSVAFTARTVQKEYVAVVSGKIAWERQTVDAPLAAAGGAIMVRQAASAGGAPAVTEFIHVGFAGERSLVRAFPKTGRLHQIRAHLAWLGHPVLGDKLYQGEGEAYLKAVQGTLAEDDLDRLGASRQLLHARAIRFKHPATGGSVEVSAPIPTDLWSALA